MRFFGETKRILSGALALCMMLALVPFSSGCAAQSDTDLMENYFVLMESQEYPRIYQYLTSEAQETVSLNDFTARYEDIYNTIGVESISCSILNMENTSLTRRIANFTMVLSTSLFGDISLTMAVPLVLESGRWRISWSPSLILPGMDVEDSARLYTLTGERGEIFDKDGELLAKNDYALSVYATVSKIKNLEDFARMAAPLLQMTEDSITSKLARYFPEETPDGSDASPTPSPSLSPSPDPDSEDEEYLTQEDTRMVLLKAYPQDALTQEEIDALLDIPGIGIDTSFMSPIRNYPFGRLFSQALGYLGTLSEDELNLEENTGLTTDTLVGKSGLEKTYESKLRGTPGYELVIVDKYGRRKSSIAKMDKQDGSDLRLTVDIKLQQKAELLMMENLTDEMAGSVIVMDPSTGYIEALASYPSYDPNQFSFTMDESTWEYLNDPNNMLPLYNRCTQGLYPPGSTIKPFTGIMGLDSGSITTNFAFTGEINNNIWVPDMDGWVYPGIKRISATPGTLNLQNALIYSDNIYFAYVALKLGADKFMQYAAQLGFGSQMDFDLPLSMSKIANDDVMTSLRLLADSGYGQGELLITPVQMAALFGSLYNDGDMLQPRLVQSICQTNGPHYDVVQENPPEIWREQVVPKNLVETVRPMLRQVVAQHNGTGHKVEVDGLGICGKTGTAQIGNDSTREIAWFIGFTTTWDHPRLVCVTLEIPAGEGQARFDIAKALFEDLKESYPPASQDTGDNAGEGGPSSND